MSYFILADCNNFYVSCERLLNPRLENKPVVVLSNNDGCVISRSQEAKNLGIKMGEPYFKIESFCKRMKIFVYSSNYKLYGDISRRIMNTFAESSPEFQIYSIDEAFMKYPSSVPLEELILTAENLRKKIKRWIGIPISIGIGPTKTLSKVANNLAKKNKATTFHLCEGDTREKIFKALPIGEVWGIGSRLAERLNMMGIYTVSDFINSESTLIRKKLGVVGERIFWELHGICCLELEDAAPKKSITCSRSFGKYLNEESDIAQALSTFAAMGCEKLRKQKSSARVIYIFLEQVSPDYERFHGFQVSGEANFVLPTHDTSEVITAAKRVLRRLYQSGHRYKKCGIIFSDLVNEENIIPDLFLGSINPKREGLMQTVDALNQKFGRNTIIFGSMGTKEDWKMRSDFKSPHNTTSWEHLPLVKT